MNKRKSGQAMTEYILVLALCAIALLLAVTFLGNDDKQLTHAASAGLRGGRAKNASYVPGLEQADRRHDTGALGGKKLSDSQDMGDDTTPAEPVEEPVEEPVDEPISTPEPEPVRFTAGRRNVWFWHHGQDPDGSRWIGGGAYVTAEQARLVKSGERYWLIDSHGQRRSQIEVAGVHAPGSDRGYLYYKWSGQRLDNSEHPWRTSWTFERVQP